MKCIVKSQLFPIKLYLVHLIRSSHICLSSSISHKSAMVYRRPSIFFIKLSLNYSFEAVSFLLRLLLFFSRLFLPPLLLPLIVFSFWSFIYYLSYLSFNVLSRQSLIVFCLVLDPFERDRSDVIGRLRRSYCLRCRVIDFDKDSS